MSWPWAGPSSTTYRGADTTGESQQLQHTYAEHLRAGPLYITHLVLRINVALHPVEINLWQRGQVSAQGELESHGLQDVGSCRVFLVGPRQPHVNI